MDVEPKLRKELARTGCTRFHSVSVEIVSCGKGLGVEIIANGDRRHHIEAPLATQAEAIDFAIEQLRQQRASQSVSG